MGRRLTVALLILLAQAFGQTAEQSEYFEKRVRPILANRCQGCHNPKTGKAGLDLTTSTGFRRGADTGPIVVPGDVENSRILQVVGYRERIKMPPTGRISEEETGVLLDWVKMGAPWPPGINEVAATSANKKKGYSQAQKNFWSFRPLHQPPLPAVREEAWAQSPIDRFVLAALEANQLSPAPRADSLTLIRRATFDLTGLPPSEEEVRAFLADHAPDAFARVVDRLLASPRYGEKWGRHWLDVARYADSTGADEDYRYPYAWRYRDYVIDAFNADLPFDQFMREQIAGDLLPPPAGKGVNTAGIVATGFLALGPKLVAEQDKVKMFYDIVDEQIDVAGKAFLGLTISCARCHDHKFDPISTKDYYSLASIFASTKQLSQIEGTVSKLYFAPLVAKDVAAEYEAHQARVADKQKEIDAVVGAEAVRFRDQFAPHIAQYMIAARRVYREGAKVEEQALGGAVLQRWVDYLKPTKERRPHLEPWYNADAETTQTIAMQYQAGFITEAARRAKAQEEFRILSGEARARGEKPPMPPKFLSGENRFFTETATGKGPLTLPPKEPEKLYTEESRRKIEALSAELMTIKKGAPPEPPFACAVAEDQPVEQHVFLRGNPDSKGEVVAKRFPTILAGEQQEPVRSGSGRMELANWLADPENPLPARVMANRIWQGHFGEALVRTPNNFGIAGERPSHPELLDWLAAEFINQGWSLKKMHRLVMLSSAYQMSADTTPIKREKDPENRLLSHFSIRRKTVEEIRDSLLLLDGSLDLTMGGSLQKGEGTDNEFSDGRKSIHPDDSNRRTVYLALRRSNLSTLFTLFDFGDATTSTENRSQTNVAPQALYMMNSKSVAEHSRALARQLLLKDVSDESRVNRAWVKILGRDAKPEEVRGSLQYVATFPAKPSDDEGRVLAWTSFCRSLVASNDFIYIY
ncbi:MAG: PSD1 and planctomycete cytochrome C domain-containing protein [Bryobacteraceae bacterium]